MNSEERKGSHWEAISCWHHTLPLTMLRQLKAQLLCSSDFDHGSHTTRSSYMWLVSPAQPRTAFGSLSLLIGSNRSYAVNLHPILSLHSTGRSFLEVMGYLACGSHGLDLRRDNDQFKSRNVQRTRDRLQPEPLNQQLPSFSSPIANPIST